MVIPERKEKAAKSTADKQIKKFKLTDIKWQYRLQNHRNLQRKKHFRCEHIVVDYCTQHMAQTENSVTDAQSFTIINF